MRTRVLFGVASVVAVVGMLWGSVTPARACTCEAGSELIELRVANADVILVGTVVDLVDDTESQRDYGYEDHDALVAVERYLKGSGGNETVVNDGTGGGDCGFIEDSDVGRRYLFMLGGAEYGRLSTGICSGNVLLDSEGDTKVTEIELIIASNPSLGRSSVDSGGDFPWLIAGVLGAACALVFLAGAAFLWRPSRTSG